MLATPNACKKTRWVYGDGSTEKKGLKKKKKKKINNEKIKRSETRMTGGVLKQDPIR